MKLNPGDFVVVEVVTNGHDFASNYTPLFTLDDPGVPSGFLLENGVRCLVVGPGLVKSLVFACRRLGWVWNGSVKHA